MWWLEIPADNTSQVVFDKNPDGVLTNLDLEMVGVLPVALVEQLSTILGKMVPTYGLS
jgi:hypothetical protein